MSDIFSGANILMSIAVGMFILYSKSVEKQFEAMKETIGLLRDESKLDDRDVKHEISKVDALRVDQITKLHERVGQAESANCSAQIKVAYLEGLHAEHK